MPGVERDEVGNYPWDVIAQIEYSANVRLPWMAVDGGAIAPAEGGFSTHGSRGTWPLPRAARVLRFTIHPPLSRSDGPSGVLTVDLTTASATWTVAPGD